MKRYSNARINSDLILSLIARRTREGCCSKPKRRMLKLADSRESSKHCGYRVGCSCVLSDF